MCVGQSDCDNRRYTEPSYAEFNLVVDVILFRKNEEVDEKYLVRHLRKRVRELEGEVHTLKSGQVNVNTGNYAHNDPTLQRILVYNDAIARPPFKVH